MRVTMGFSVFFALTILGGPIACSSSSTNASPPPGGGGLTSVKVVSATQEGDFKLSGRLGVDAGQLSVALAAIRDPDKLTSPVDPTTVTIGLALTREGAASTALNCTVTGVTSTSKASVDLVFINDTTGSMSGTVKGIADSISAFASALTAGGVDARYSMYTYGDAFATKLATDTSFTIGKGDFDPPSFDNTARPYIGLSELTPFSGFLDELKASKVLGVGGGDGEENTLGALHYANTKVAWRDGAARMFVAIGDNPSHQSDDKSSIVAAGTATGDAGTAGPGWFTTGAAVVAELNGNAAVHVVGHNTEHPPYYNLKTLADQTGGAFLELPSDGKVDLGSLNLKDWLLKSYNGKCTDATTGSAKIGINVTIKGTKTYTGKLTFTVVIS